MEKNTLEKICIIIPVYNVESYVERCINSILTQSYKNLEIIIVNDGSTDNSLKICLEATKNDSRVTVVSKTNGGLSDARNYGLKFCKSELVTFIDSDDYVSKDYIKNLYELMQANGADISCTSYISFYQSDKIRIKSDRRIKLVYNPEQAIIDVLYQKNIANSAWGKLYKTILFKNISFPKGRLCEDLAIFYKLFAKSHMIVYQNIQDYYYLQRKTSIMGSDFNENKLDALFFAKEILNSFSKSEIKQAAKARICAECVNLLRQMSSSKNHNKKEVLTILRKYSPSVLFDGKVKFLLKIKILLNIIGL
jgi:Glycosyltransferases, probably involved in cell wall biogenesis